MCAIQIWKKISVRFLKLEKKTQDIVRLKNTLRKRFEKRILLKDCNQLRYLEWLRTFVKNKNVAVPKPKPYIVERTTLSLAFCPQSLNVLGFAQRVSLKTTRLN